MEEFCNNKHLFINSELRLSKEIKESFDFSKCVITSSDFHSI